LIRVDFNLFEVYTIKCIGRPIKVKVVLC